MIGGQQPHQAEARGPARPRADRPHAPCFRYTGPGQLQAKAAASQVRGRGASARRRDGQEWLISGARWRASRTSRQRLSKRARCRRCSSSDAIRSSAYANGRDPAGWLVPGRGRGAVPVEPAESRSPLLLAVVAISSYRQGCFAFPGGGGVVRRGPAESCRRSSGTGRCGRLARRLHRMTVAVSDVVGDGAGDLDLRAWRRRGRRSRSSRSTLIMIGNLRGLRESGNIFAIPTYLFAGHGADDRRASGRRHRLPAQYAAPEPAPGARHTVGGGDAPARHPGVCLPGSVALTGTEAIANGVPAFKPPSRATPPTTLTVDGGLARRAVHRDHVRRRRVRRRPVDAPAAQTVISQVRRQDYGDGPLLFYLFQIATALILFLAANTSFNAFPRLAAILARDGYMPRQFELPRRSARVHIRDHRSWPRIASGAADRRSAATRRA